MCPFCGKTYKRLKSHLPHCKAASRPNTPPISHEDAQRSSRHRLNDRGDAPLQKLAVGAGPRSKKSTKVSAASPQTASQTGNSSSASLPSPAGTRKQKPSEPVKAAPVPPPQPPGLNTKQKTGQELLEAAGPRKGTRTAPKHLSTAQYATQTGLSAEPAPQPPASRGSSETKVSKKKATRAGSVSQNDERQENVVKPSKNKDLVTTERTTDDLSLNMESGDGLESKIILQNVKTVLGRDRKSPKSSRPSILVQIQSCDPSSRITPSASLSQAPLPTGKSEDQFLRSSSSSPAPASPLTPFPPAPPPSQGHRATVGLSAESPSLSRFSGTKLLPARVAHGGPVTETVPLQDRKPASSDKGWWWTNRRPRLLVDHLNPPVFCLCVHSLCAVGVLAQQSLAQVRLKDLPGWLVWKTPTHPGDLVKMAQKGEGHTHTHTHAVHQHYHATQTQPPTKSEMPLY